MSDLTLKILNRNPNDALQGCKEVGTSQKQLESMEINNNDQDKKLTKWKQKEQHLQSIKWSVDSWWGRVKRTGQPLANLNKIRQKLIK